MSQQLGRRRWQNHVKNFPQALKGYAVSGMQVVKANPKTTLAVIKTAGKVADAVTRKPQKKSTIYEKVHVDAHGGISYSKFKKYRKPKNKLEKKLAAAKGKITRRYIGTEEVTADTGRQLVKDFMYFETDHLKKMVSDVWDNTSLRDMGRPILPNNAPASISEGGLADYNDLAPYIHGTNHKLTISNFENSTTQVKIYDLVCKKDTDELPSIAWVRGMQEQGESAGLHPAFPIGTKPTQSKVFNEKWRVEGIAALQLKPGENHKHSIKVTPHMSVANTRVSSTGGLETPKKYLAGVTRACIVIAEGVLIASAASTEVSTAPTTLGSMWERSYTFSANLKNHRVSIPPVNTMPVITRTNARFAQEDGDIATTSVAT